MTIHFDRLIKRKQAITYIDDTIMQSQNKNEMFTIINDYHTLLRKAGDAKDNSPIDSFVISLLLQTFRTGELFEHLDQTWPSLIFSAEM